MDDIDPRLIDQLNEPTEPEVDETSNRRVPVAMTVIEALEVAESFKQKLVDESYEAMLEDGEAEVKVPMEVVDALEVLVHYVNTSFEVDEEF